MKKSRIVLLMAMLLAAVMLLSSCGATELDSIKFAKIADGSVYADSDPAYAAATEISALKNAEDADDFYNNVLVFFADEVEVDGHYRAKYMVYNVETNAVVYSATETEVTEIYVELYEAEGSEFFAVYTTTYAKKDDVVDFDDYTETTALYDETGAQLATANRGTDCEVSWDLIRFDGKIYRVAEDGTIAYAFDYPEFSTLPRIYEATENYYYATNFRDERMIGPTTLIVLDKELNVVSTYTVASYAEILSAIVLGNDKIMAQYIVEKDDFDADYDFYDEVEDEKYDLYTVMINGKNGKVEEIELNYVIEEPEVVDDETRKYCGVNEKVYGIAAVAPIENRRINKNAALMAVISENGKLSVVEQINGQNVRYFELVSTDRWLVSTSADLYYLINEKGEVVGEISGIEDVNEAYLITDSKLYDYSLNMVYDYAAANLEIEEVYGSAILFENKDGELISYANGTATTLIAKDADREFVDMYSYSDLFVIVDYTDEENIKYEVYNEAATKILTLDYSEEAFGIDRVWSNYEGKAILCVTGWDIDNLEATHTYYRLG